ncbi:hypothetical protein A2W45_00270 [Candidatus Curtissbacteria bacterium RIFCSPHIGHO2_12_41_11]|uniref:TIGR01906 family membrane protein n=2 Tax=Candidatus Curtissiibacteriota TaxID=1752717 RepID=A0A1F5H4Q7_9BACT|nr:MAG: hypothetical protein A3D07_01965 [Candidatus Curtissbacteria bacterium RIFCSPHIGHO2_02_FULL_42_15]OGD99068.1 MAG: hypothetical protein A2W45_00270 [Candidatus Curtissbacteria bacterium RIFCSPHIGHO2_12_41_11]
MKAISYLFFIFFAPALILINFNFLIFNHGFYKSQFEKLNVYETFGSKGNVDDQSEKLIGYLCCGKELDSDFFGERERLHLADVKKIITFNQAASILFVGLVLVGLLILILKKDEKEFAKTVLGASAITVCAIIFLWLSALFNFDWIFLKFHYLTFDNDLWQLPESANLIKLFPQQFFVNFANRVAIQTLVISAGLFLVSFYFLKRHDSKKH